MNVNAIDKTCPLPVLYAYNVKKGNFQSAAEAFAKHFKDDYLKKVTH